MGIAQLIAARVPRELRPTADIWETEHRLLHALGRTRPPAAVQWMVTRSCDLHCGHCYAQAGRKAQGAGIGAITQARGGFGDTLTGRLIDFRVAVEGSADRGLRQAEMLGQILQSHPASGPGCGMTNAAGAMQVLRAQSASP